MRKWPDEKAEDVQRFGLVLVSWKKYLAVLLGTTALLLGACLLVPSTWAPFLSFLAVGFLLLGFLFSKQLSPRYCRTVELSSQGIRILETSREARWENIHWHRYDFNSVLYENLVFGLKGQAAMHFPVARNSEEYADWHIFRKTALELLEKQNPQAKNYYHGPFWRLLAYFIAGSSYILPFLLYGLGFPIREILPKLLIFIGASTAFAAVIFYNNRCGA